jgi:hypothetical protein
MKQLIGPMILLLCFAALAKTGADLLQPHADFVSASQNHSTSPSYIKVNVTDAQTGRTFVTCVTANLFMGAVHIEHGYPYTDRGVDSAEQLVASNTSHVFSFRNAKALANMPWHPSPRELSQAAELVARVPSDVLRSSLKKGELFAFYMNHPRRREREAALACALIDQGHRPRAADISGQLYVER